MQWIDGSVSFRAGLKSSHQELPTENALFSLVVRGAKYGG